MTIDEWNSGPFSTIERNGGGHAVFLFVVHFIINPSLTTVLSMIFTHNLLNEDQNDVMILNFLSP